MEHVEVTCEPARIRFTAADIRCPWVNLGKEDAVLGPDEPITLSCHGVSIPRSTPILDFDVSVVTRFETWWSFGHRFEEVRRFVARQGPTGEVIFEPQPVDQKSLRECRESRARASREAGRAPPAAAEGDRLDD